MDEEPQPWYLEESWLAQLHGGAQDRVARWKARWNAKVAGGPVLSLEELGTRIKQTQLLIKAASAPGDVAVLRVQLEDMKREFDWRTFLDVDKTIWPADRVGEPAEMLGGRSQTGVALKPASTAIMAIDRAALGRSRARGREGEPMAEVLPDLSEAERRFVAAHPHAAMITVDGNNRPKAVKMEAAVVDGCLQSASHADKVRTRRLRRDPRCTLYFADEDYRWLSVEADVEIVAGTDAPPRLLRFFRVREDKPTELLDYHSDRGHYSGLDDQAFMKVMAEEDAVLYRFKITKCYGNR